MPSRAICDNSNVIQYRRIAAIVLGGWLGAGTFADFAVTQNFQTVDRFLASPGSNVIAMELEKIGADRERPILRRNAGEENGFLFRGWETAELAIGAAVIGLLLVGGKRSGLVLSPAVLMLLIVVAQRFYLSPEVTDLGRRIADLSAADPRGPQLNSQFWTAHGIYSGLEIFKLLLGAFLAVLLVLPHKRDLSHAGHEHEPELMTGIGARSV
jgi:hypothetical protein